LIADSYVDVMGIDAIPKSAAMPAAAGGAYFVDDIPVPQLHAAMRGEAACNIKGNISDRHRRAHLSPARPGIYDRTRISPQYGEHWFCSKAEARAAGWRSAKE
jgi:hypothetical protein